MVDKAEAPQEVSKEITQAADQKARDRAMNARWDLNIAIFLFAVLLLVIILINYTKLGIETVGPIAAFSLGMVWLVGWRRGKELHQRFYQEELEKLGQESKTSVKAAVKETLEETIEEQVQKALRNRWR